MSKRDDRNEANAQASAAANDAPKPAPSTDAGSADDEVAGYLMEGAEEDEVQTFFGQG